MAHRKTSPRQAINLLEKWNQQYLNEHGTPLEVGSPAWLGIAYNDVAEVAKACFLKNGRAGEICTVDDLVSATWHRIQLRLLPNLINKSTQITPSFVYTSALYCLRDAYRRSVAKIRMPADGITIASQAGSTDLLDNAIGSGMRTPSGVLMAQEQSEQLCEILERVLNENDFLLVILRHFMDYSFKEISLLFDRNEHSLRSRYSQVLSILRPEFAKKFPTSFETAQRLGNEPEIDRAVNEFVATLGTYALERKWDAVHACLAPWMQDRLMPCDVQDFFVSAYAQTLTELGITAEHFPEGLAPEISGSACVTADNLRQPIDWLGGRTRNIPDEVTDENMRFWARLTLLGSKAQSMQLKISTFAEIWMAVVETELGLRVGYWSQSAYECNRD